MSVGAWNVDAYGNILAANETAISVADRILAIEPNNIKALSNKGTALANIGYTYDAISIFEKGLGIDPNNQGVWYYSV